MDTKNELFTAEKRVKVTSLIIFALLLITIWSLLDLVLMTFILCFLFYSLLEKIRKLCGELGVPIVDALVLSILYAVFVAILIVACGIGIPLFVAKITDIANQLVNFNWIEFRNALSPSLQRALGAIDVSSYISSGTLYITKFMTNLSTLIAGLAINLALAVLLSFLILLEKGKIATFGEYLGTSLVSEFYHYFVKFGKNFCVTFGQVMRVQVTIAFVNCILSAIAFSLIGLTDIVGLSIMIFFLGLIPVAGVIISLIPLSTIAFNVGGIIKIVEVIVTICILHGVEAYILNPKLMASKTQLPVCFVFSILLVAEHYIGVWGLLIGVPIFMFMLDALGVDYEKGMIEEREKKAAVKAIKKAKRKMHNVKN